YTTQSADCARSRVSPGRSCSRLDSGSANSAMFGIIDRLMFRAPAYSHDPSRVNRVYEQLSLNGGREIVRNNFLLYPEYVDVTRWAKRFDRFAALGSADA